MPGAKVWNTTSSGPASGDCAVCTRLTGTRSWIQRLVIRGRKRELGFGSVALVSLAEAREKALTNRKLAREGGDPLAEKRCAQGVPSFAETTARVLEQKQAGCRSATHPRDWLSNLERYAFPRIGKMPVSEVTSADVLEILTPIWTGRRSQPGASSSACARYWNGPWRWSSGSTTRVTGSSRCSVPNTTSYSTCVHCPTKRCRRPWRRSGHRMRDRS